MFERVVYTNSLGGSVELSAGSLFHCNVRKIKGLTSVKNTVYRTQAMNTDGNVRTGNHIESRSISIMGNIKATPREGLDDYIAQLIEVFSPHATGTLRYEGITTREIAVEVEGIDDIDATKRWPSFTVDLIALDPNWTETAHKTADIAYDGTDVFYEGTKSCGVVVTITANADTVDMESFTITSKGVAETVSFLTAGGVSLDTGDVLVLDTGAKTLTLNGVNAFTRLDLANTSENFARLYRGINTITWLANDDEADFDVSISYLPTYLTGVS